MKKQTIKKANVNNMISPSSGRSIPNQFEIRTTEGIYFQSYATVICHIDTTGQVYLDPKWKYSRTTSKYRNLFLNESTKETQEKIDTGEYIITRLNYKGKKGENMKLKKIEIQAKEWRDTLNGNSYFSAIVTLNDDKEILIPFEYGYGQFFEFKSMRELIKRDLLPEDVASLTKYCRENDIELVSNKEEDCLKREVLNFVERDADTRKGNF